MSRTARIIVASLLAAAMSQQPVTADDYYEPNDSPDWAYDLSWDERRWLSSIAGAEEQWDDDWYRVYVDHGYERLVLDLRYSEYWGDIDLELYDASGWRIDASYSSSDDEYLEVVVPYAGEYLVRVHWSNSGNTYDLWWDDMPTYSYTDDAYEPNDSEYQAYDLSSWEGYALSEIAGRGLQADEDWYSIYVDGNADSLEVVLRFDHGAGDIDLELYDAWGDRISYSQSSSDGERITVYDPAPGYYQGRVYAASRGNTSDRTWRTDGSFGSGHYGSGVRGGGGSSIGLVLLLAIMGLGRCKPRSTRLT
jgi:hypothetical protein